VVLSSVLQCDTAVGAVQLFRYDDSVVLVPCLYSTDTGLPFVAVVVSISHSGAWEMEYVAVVLVAEGLIHTRVSRNLMPRYRA